MKLLLTSVFLLTINLTDVIGKIFFEERFLKGNTDNWTPSSVEVGKLGKIKFANAIPPVDAKEDGGLKTTQKARFYRLSAPFKETLKNKGKNMCVQFSVKYPKNVECSGGYVKLIGENFKQDKFDGETPYEIMFGPDVCGFETRLVHLIFSHKGRNHLIRENIPFNGDNMTHLFRLNVFPNNSFSVLVDEEMKRNGTLVDEFDMVKPREIDDPEDKKPEDWVDEAEILDTTDKKPDDWDQPETIADPKTAKPEDWNDETDGEWTPPKIRNPNFRGKWRQKMIPNPAFKGVWKPKKIPNPDFVDDPTLYERKIKYIGLDLWQVQPGSIFDNFIVSDNLNECDEHTKYWKERHDVEVELKERYPQGASLHIKGVDDEQDEDEDEDEEKKEGSVSAETSFVDKDDEDTKDEEEEDEPEEEEEEDEEVEREEKKEKKKLHEEL